MLAKRKKFKLSDLPWRAEQFQLISVEAPLSNLSKDPFININHLGQEKKFFGQISSILYRTSLQEEN